jgi:toxin ParE1/3/4
MAEIIWTEPALQDLDAIADYIALYNSDAAAKLVQKVFRHIEQLARHPESGSKPPELKGLPYRQMIELPCRIFYRCDGQRIFILYVMRAEKLLRKKNILQRD